MSTATATHTNIDVYAHHIADKVAADLKRLQRLYGIDSPTDIEIDAHQKELHILLAAGLLGTITYGYLRNNKWIVALKYQAINGGVSGSDSSGIRLEADLSGSHFSSILIYSSGWDTMPEQERLAFEKSLPFQREKAEEPNTERGYWAEGIRYTAGGLGVQRLMIQIN